MPPTILVVDDDPDLCQSLVAALRDVGYLVEQAAGDGIMALEQISTCVPDLILSDVRMPRLDGIGLARLLAPHTPAIPVILMSASPLPSDCPLPALRKPFTLEDLLTLMARTLPTSVAAIALAGLGAV
jgi:CheY-like chemotaxis protein